MADEITLQLENTQQNSQPSSPGGMYSSYGPYSATSRQGGYQFEPQYSSYGPYANEYKTGGEEAQGMNSWFAATGRQPNTVYAADSPQISGNTTANKNAGSSGNSAGGVVGAVFDMVNQVVGNLESIGEFFGASDAQQTQKEQFNRSFNEQKRRFDMTFWENIRQFDLDYALREFQIRKGLSLQETRELWDRYTQGIQLGENTKDQQLNREIKEFDFEAAKSAYNKKMDFAKAFSNAITGNLKSSRNKK
jgi:hypothetical protein